jgi:hypothetical protein
LASGERQRHVLWTLQPLAEAKRRSLQNTQQAATMAEERFIPERKKLDQLSIVKDYATTPRLEYR